MITPGVAHSVTIMDNGCGSLSMGVAANHENDTCFGADL